MKLMLIDDEGNAHLVVDNITGIQRNKAKDYSCLEINFAKNIEEVYDKDLMHDVCAVYKQIKDKNKKKK